MFQYNQRINSIPQNIWSLINQIDELKGQWIGGVKLNPQALGRLKRWTLITSSGSSTRIEGSKMSDEEVEAFIRGLKTQKFSDRDKQEVKGYYELLENIFNSWQHISFTERTIKHFHKELLKYSEKDKGHLGEYKKGENKVEMFNASGKSLGVIFDTTPAYLTPKQMQELVDWAKEALALKSAHPLLIIGNFLVEFLAIHPFQDGNGRLSRILTNLLMLKTGYAYAPYVSQEKLVEDNKAEYYVALRRSQKNLSARGGSAYGGKDEQTDISDWLEFFLGICLAQGKMAIDLLSKENIEKLLSPKQLLVWQYLEKASEATPLEITKMAKVARPTVSQALEVLLRLKKIERIGQGRATRYRKI